MKKLLTTLFASCMLISASAQSVTTASSSMTASPWAQQVPFDISAEGKKFNFATGMGGWSDIQFAYKQRNWVGKYATVARLNFFGRNNTSGNLATSLSEEQLRKGITFSFPDGTSGSHNGIDTDLDIIAPSGVKDILLLCDMDMRVRLSASDWNNTNRVNYYVNDIALAVEYLESKGYNVISAAPFNEPDFDAIGNCGKSASVFNKVAAAMQQHPTLKGRVCGPNTLNTNPAVEWYATIKNNVDIINTHQLAGSFEHLVEFWDTGIADGKQAVADEMHNVMEAMVVMNHGGRYGTWWGYDGVARAEFARVTSAGSQLAYEEDAPSLTVAGVYRYDGDAGMDANRVKAIIGTSERQAVAKSYTFVSRDRLAYYDGYGPTYDYTQDVPGGVSGSYQNGQTNAERVLNVYTGEDVPVESVDGLYKIVNKKSGKILSTRGGKLADTVRIRQYGEGVVANQVWKVNPVHHTVGGDYSYHFITNTSPSGFTYYLDNLNWGLDNGSEVCVYPGGGSGCEQWHLRYVGDGYYTIINRHSGLCLEVLDGNTADGAGVVQMMADESDAQLWKFVPSSVSVDVTAPTTPTGLTATPQSGAVKLTWAANVDEDIFGYMVYRYNAAVGIWECIGRKVQGTTFLDNTCRKGQPLRYRIRALDKAYNLSEPSAEVETMTATDKTMIAQWIGLSLKDNTPNKMHAVANGTTFTIDSEYPSISFEGTDDYLKLPYHAGDMKEMTFAAWVKGGSTTKNQHVFDFGNGTDECFFLTPTNGSRMRFEIKKGGVTQGLDATTTLGTGTWKHVAVTIGANEVAIYINGAKNASTTGITLRPSDIEPIMSYLGRSQSISDPAFKGLMSDVRLYNYALSADEVKSISSEIVSVDGLDITAERIPNIADNVNNWTVSGGWTTWTSTADGSGLSSPYVRIGTSGTSRISKTLNYLPEGTYTLSASCMSYYYYAGAIFGIGAGEKDVTGVTFFANDQSITVNTKSNKASKALSITASLTNVSNTLEFGINANSTNATILAMDNMTLVYQGTAAEYIEGIEAITYKMTSEASLLTGKLMSAATKQALLDALNSVESTLSNYTTKIASGKSTPVDAVAWITAMEAIETCIPKAKQSIEAYTALGAQITASRAKATLYPQETCGSIDEFGLNEIYAKCVKGEYLDEEISAIVIEVKGLTNRYVMADAVEYATADNPIDVANLVMGYASFENDSYTPGWKATPVPTLSYNSLEYYNLSFFSISQILYGMPKGTYRFEVQGFYRQGSQEQNKASYTEGNVSREVRVYMDANGNLIEAPLMAISDDFSETNGAGGWYQYDANKFVPDNMHAASVAIDQYGKYAPKDGYNSVTMQLEDIADITVGAIKEAGWTNDWTFFGGFKLYYLGDGKHRLWLDEAAEKAPAINEEITYDEVTLKRTLKAGVWNTFVSPFDIPAHMLGNWEVKELVHSSFKGEVLSLTFDNAADGIKAGVPYMVRDTLLTEDLTEIKMRGIKVSSEMKHVTTPEGDVTFTGVYHYGPMPEGAFFISNNTFYQVPVDGDDSNNNKSKAFRAYLMPVGEAVAARSLCYRTDGVVDEDDNDDDNDDDDEDGDEGGDTGDGDGDGGDDNENGDNTGEGDGGGNDNDDDDDNGDGTGDGDGGDNGGDDNDDEDENEGGDTGDGEGDVAIESVKEELAVVAIYNANGVRILDMQKGLNILQMSDGTRIRVLIR